MSTMGQYLQVSAVFLRIKTGYFKEKSSAIVFAVTDLGVECFELRGRQWINPAVTDFLY
jgi:hypothetical protein